jgi:hypothetical protein
LPGSQSWPAWASYWSSPLQGFTVWRFCRLSNAVSYQQQARATQRAETVRQAIQQATSADDLQKRLLALQRPDLQIRLNTDQFPFMPLPELKQRLLSQPDQAEGQVKEKFSRLDPGSNDRWLRESLSVMVSSIALAITIAALGQRRNSPVPFLIERQGLLGRLSGGGLPASTLLEARQETNADKGSRDVGPTSLRGGGTTPPQAILADPPASDAGPP